MNFGIISFVDSSFRFTFLRFRNATIRLRIAHPTLPWLQDLTPACPLKLKDNYIPPTFCAHGLCMIHERPINRCRRNVNEIFPLLFQLSLH